MCVCVCVCMCVCMCVCVCVRVCTCGELSLLQDGKRSAQFEHTLIVTDTGSEILTGRRDHDGLPHFLTPS